MRHGACASRSARRRMGECDTGGMVSGTVDRARGRIVAVASSRSVAVAVVGGGPSGLTAAIALASAGFEVALVARAAPADNRTTALLASSVAALEALGVWDDCRAHAAPLAALRIVDATRRLWRAPEALFEAQEIGLDAFA